MQSSQQVDNTVKLGEKEIKTTLVIATVGVLAAGLSAWLQNKINNVGNENEHNVELVELNNGDIEIDQDYNALRAARLLNAYNEIRQGRYNTVQNIYLTQDKKAIAYKFWNPISKPSHIFYPTVDTKYKNTYLCAMNMANGFASSCIKTIKTKLGIELIMPPSATQDWNYNTSQIGSLQTNAQRVFYYLGLADTEINNAYRSNKSIISDKYITFDNINKLMEIERNIKTKNKVANVFTNLGFRPVLAHGVAATLATSPTVMNRINVFTNEYTFTGLLSFDPLYN